MIRLILITVLLLLSFVAVDAQKLYAIAFAITDDANIGSINQRDLSCFEDYVDGIASELKCEKVCITKTGDECTKHALEETIKEIQPTANDVVIFVYLGFGGRSYGDESEFPQMTLTENREEDFVPLEDVKTELEKKDAGFVFVIGNCDNVFQGLSPKKNVLKVEYGKTNTVNDSSNSDKYGLFSSKGSVIISASSKGECSWAASVNGETQSLFMYVLLNELKHASSTSSWEEVFSIVRQKVADCFQEYIKGKIRDFEFDSSQTPAFAIDIH